MDSKPSRLRQTDLIRNGVRETRLSLDSLVMPLFFKPGSGTQSVPSMPGIDKMGESSLLREIEKLDSIGIKSVLLFGSVTKKDENGSAAYDEKSPFHAAIRKIKKASDVTVIADVCLCAYTTHGHCGIFGEGTNEKQKAPSSKKTVRLDPDRTLEALAKTAVSYAAAGADIVAPSAMADGQVGAIRERLDTQGFCGTPIMSYSVKYASSFYGPFRDIAGTHPAFGDRKTYQMDPANRREAIREVLLDVEEGADIVMVKPALAFLDIIREVRQAVKVPVAAYNVSGEYAMLKAAAQKGWLDEKSAVLETLTSIKRAGADVIITYWAKQAAEWLRG